MSRDIGLPSVCKTSSHGDTDDTILSLLRYNIAREYIVSEYTLKNAIGIYGDIGSLEFMIRIAVTRESNMIHTTICRILLETFDSYFMRKPRSLITLLNTYPKFIVLTRPYTYTLSFKYHSEAVGLNLYGFMLMTYRDRYLTGVSIYGNRSSNAAAVARMHHIYNSTCIDPMIGTALPGLSADFDPSSFPQHQSSNMSNVKNAKGEEEKTHTPRIPISSPDSFRGVTINVGKLGETTPSKSSSISTGNRHWKAPITFASSKIESTPILCVEDVYVLPSGNKNSSGKTAYAKTFVNISIPGYVREEITKAITDIYPECNPDEVRFAPNENRWFKVVNNLDSLLTVGKVDDMGRPIMVKLDVKETMDVVQYGAKISADLEFSVKAKGVPIEPVGPADDIRKVPYHNRTFTVDINAVRGMVSGMCTSPVDMPQYTGGQSAKISAGDLTFRKTDLTPDNVIKMFADLGLNV